MALNEAALDRYIADAMPTTSLFDRYERECAAAHAKHGDELPKDVRKALQSLYIAAYCENRDSLKGEEKEYFLLKEREFSLDTQDKARLRALHWKFYGLPPFIFIEVFPVPTIPNGYGAFKFKHAMQVFTGEGAKAQASEYAESLLDDLRYEAERG